MILLGAGNSEIGRQLPISKRLPFLGRGTTLAEAHALGKLAFSRLRFRIRVSLGHKTSRASLITVVDILSRPLDLCSSMPLTRLRTS